MQKYGGTSVADPGRIQAVADHIVATRRSGAEVLVVVSAMGDTTDDLERLAFEVSSTPSARELDMLLTAGERISIALLCMAIIDRGEHAVSFTGSQAGILTDTTHGRAKIVEVRADRLRDTLAAGQIAVVAGFQGVSTTRGHHHARTGRLGHDRGRAGRRARRRRLRDLHRRGRASSPPTRGWSPTPAASTGCRTRRCSTSPPPAAGSWRCARSSSPATTTCRSTSGSSFTWAAGTWVGEEDPSMEQAIISGVTHNVTEAKVTIVRVPDRPGIARQAVPHPRRRERSTST